MNALDNKIIQNGEQNFEFFSVPGKNLGQTRPLLN